MTLNPKPKHSREAAARERWNERVFSHFTYDITYDISYDITTYDIIVGDRLFSVISFFII